MKKDTKRTNRLNLDDTPTAPMKEDSKGRFTRIGELLKKSPGATRFVSKLDLSRDDAIELVRLLKE